MDKLKIKKLETALENDEEFLSFLAQEARSDEYREMKEKVEAGHHPSGDSLWHYVMGGLTHKGSGSVRDHIAYCEMCADEVMMLRQNESEEEPEDDIGGLVARGPTLDEKFRKFVSNLSSMFDTRAWVKPLTAGLSMAMVCLIIYLGHWHFRPVNIETLIARSYQADAVREMKFENVALNLPSESSEQAFGLAPGGRHSPESRSFGAGVWSGSEEIRGRDSEIPVSAMPDILSPKWKGGPDISADDWKETSWSIFFHAGRWCFLLRALCLSEAEIPNELWEKQQIILEKIQKKVVKGTGTEAQVITATLRRIGQDMEDSAPDESRQEKIASDLENMIIYLMPGEARGEG